MKNIIRGIIFWIIVLAFIFVMFTIVKMNAIINLVYVLLGISIVYILKNI